jgi:natural product precursor
MRMKKLSKIKLKDAVVLEDSEMKMIYGGSGLSICANMTSQSICFTGFGCTDQDGNQGHCGWVTAWSQCVCVSGG